MLFESGKRYVSTLVLKASDGQPVIHLEEPGTLSEMFGADARQTPSLKITGTMNVLDFLTISSMSHLRHLDLSEANIAEQEDIGFGYFPANTIPEYGLNGVQLQTIVLPNSLTAIGNEAFSVCTNLTGDLTIPSGVTSIGSRAFLACSGLTGYAYDSRKRRLDRRNGFRRLPVLDHPPAESRSDRVQYGHVQFRFDDLCPGRLAHRL